MNQLTEVHLIKGTGIGGGNYKYFSGKGDADAFFLGKSFMTLNDYSFIRPNEHSKHGYNVACIHVDLPYDESLECDYISYKHSEYGRWFHAMVMDREYVNPESSRLYFTVDYVATYWDLIEIEKCFVERTHVDDDWEGNEIVGTMSANKYLLPEPVTATAYHRPELNLIGDALLNSLNSELDFVHSEFNYITSVPPDGKLEPRFYFQAGECCNGHIEHGTQQQVQEQLKTYPTFMHKLINMGDTALQYVSSIYFCPKVVAQDAAESTKMSIKRDVAVLPLIEWIPYDRLPPIKHAKTLMYFRYNIRCCGEDLTFAAHESGNYPNFTAFYTGTNRGRAYLYLNSQAGEFIGRGIKTDPWVDVVNGNLVQQKEAQVNTSIKRGLAAGLENNVRLMEGGAIPY